MKLTIADIAEKAGVSKATVSRVLNNRPEGVGPETRARILEIVRNTGFKPSAVARGLATGESRSVGLVIPDITNPFYPQLVRGVEKVLNEAGYSLLLCNSDRSVDKEIESLRVLTEKGIDGVILDSAGSECDCQVQELEEHGVPIVLLDRVIDNRNSRYGVFVDNQRGACEAVQFLLSRAQCSLVYINGAPTLSQSIERRAGVERAFREKGISLDALAVLDGDFTLESGYRQMESLLASTRGAGKALPFSAVFAANDLMAIGALRALKQHGVAVPDEVEVIGFDDIELAHLLDPPLSTVFQPALEMGSQSATLLLRLIGGKKPRNKTIVLTPTLVLRGSTRP